MNEVRLFLHPSDQPVFRLLADVSGCVAGVWINDVPVWSNADGAAGRAMLSVNEWLFAGDNKISVRLAPPPGHQGEPRSESVLPETASVELTLLCKKNRAPWLAQQEVTSASYSHAADFKNAGIFNPHPHDHDHTHPADSEEAAEEPTAPTPAATPPVLIRPGEQTPLTVSPLPADWLEGGAELGFGFRFTLPPVWPACPWSRAADLSGMGGLDYTAGRLARSLADSLQRRDWNTLRRLFADRRAAVQAAYYLTDSAADEALTFPRMLQAADSLIAPVPDEVSALLCGGGRLLKLPPLRLTCPSMHCLAEIDSFWMHTGQDWRMVR